MTKTIYISDAIKLVREWIGILDDKANGYVSKIEQLEGQRTSCRQCRSAGCCFQLVTVHLFEALPIAQRLRADRLDTPQLRAKLLADAQLMEQSPARAVYMDHNRPCTFLSDRNRCNVYRDRPIACRTYHVWSDPELCGPPSGKDKILAFDNGQFFAAAGEFGVQFTGNEMGIPSTESRVLAGVLPRVVLSVLESWDAPNFITALEARPWPTYEEYNRINGAGEENPRGTIHKQWKVDA